MALRRDVRDAPSGVVVEGGVGVADRVEVLVDHGRLVRRLCVVDAEATAGEGHGALRGRGRRGTHGGHVGAAGGEGGLESGGCVVDVGLAGSAWAGVARGEEDRDAARPELHEKVAYFQGVVLWHGLLLFAVGGGEGLRELGVRLVENKGEEFKIWFVGTGEAVVEGRDEGAGIGFSMYGVGI